MGRPQAKADEDLLYDYGPGSEGERGRHEGWVIHCCVTARGGKCNKYPSPINNVESKRQSVVDKRVARPYFFFKY